MLLYLHFFAVFEFNVIKKNKKNFFKIILFFFSQICVHINIWFQPSILIKFNHSMTFFNTNPWFNSCFKFLMCITYSFWSCKLATSFSTFSKLVLSGKSGKSLWSLCKFSRYWTSTSRKYPSSLSSLYFFY